MKCTERGIQEITLNTPTLHGVRMTPRIVNFLFGHNGTGKSCIARALAASGAEGSGAGREAPDIRLYNEAYIREQVHGRGDVPGIYTFSRHNVETQQAIEAAEREKAELEAALEEKTALREQQRESLDRAREARRKMIWRATAGLRKRFPDAVGEAGESLERFETELSRFRPEESPEEALDCAYQAAFRSGLRAWQPWRTLSALREPVSDLMDIPVMSGSDASLSVFFRTLGNFDWARTGHDRFGSRADGLCPYCGEALPADFERQFAACLDNRYQRDLDALEAFSREYERFAEEAEALLESNRRNDYESRETLQYHAKAETLKSMIRNNRMIIRRKIENPREELVPEDLSPVRDSLEALGAEISRSLDRYREAAENLPREQKRCRALIWKAMAAACAELPSTEDGLELAQTENDILRTQFDLKQLDARIAELRSAFVDTTEAMDGMNQVLDKCGYTGFSFRKKAGDPGAYELIRCGENEPAKHLSEGERNFVAFLYFHHTVMRGGDGEGSGKVVVIDDPVGSMDSQAMMTVAMMIREMIRSCLSRYENRNEGSPILQLFLLSHNEYFFRTVSDFCVPDSRRCAFFEVTKDRNNVSGLRKCERQLDQPGLPVGNESPAQGFYQTLWRKYAAARDPMDILLHAQRILWHYFIQTCHYSEEAFLRALTDDNREFPAAGENAAEEQRNTAVISALITMMNENSRGFSEDMSFDPRAVDPRQIREVFAKIFSALHQEEHYQFMLRSTEKMPVGA